MLVKKRSSNASKGKILVGSKDSGAGIYGPDGEPIWFLPGRTMDFRVQRYQGKPVLTWYQAPTPGSGLKRPAYIIANRNYKVIKKVYPGNGLNPDSHEFRLTPRGTALVTAYRNRQYNLSSFGFSSDVPLSESIAQEVDVKTGRLLWQWNSLAHVPVRDTYAEKLRRPNSGFDYFHINTVTTTRDGNILISGRSTNAMYKINRKTGRVIWTLGGRSSDFKMGKGAFFSSQHDTEQIGSNLFSLFDNGASPVTTALRKQSRGLVLKLNFKKMTASVKRQFFNPAKPLATQQANMERVGGSRFFIGWGGVPLISEHSSSGQLLFDAEMQGIGSFYRAYLQQWTGQPRGRVALVAQETAPDRTRLWASWNGDSQVRKWLVLAGGSPKSLKKVGYRKRDGFETVANVPNGSRYFRVVGFDSNNRKLGYSKVVRNG